MKKTLLFPENRCPSCYKKIDAATRFGDDNSTPNPGDLTICMYCQELLKFTDDMRTEKLSEEEISKLPVEVKLEITMLKKAAKKITNEEIFNNKNDINLPDKS